MSAKSLEKSLCIASITIILNCTTGLHKSVKTIHENSRIVKIDTGISNVFLIKDSKNILIDASEEGSEDLIKEKLAEFGIQARDLSLIILTHGHGDHAGSAPYFQSKYKIPVMGGRADTVMFEKGENSTLTPNYFFARIVKLFSDKKYKPFKPDILIDKQVDLTQYGLAAIVRPMPGHTPGSLVILMENKQEAVVGDLLRGSVMDDFEAEEHFFHENRMQVRKNIKDLLKEGYKIFYTGHFGPVDHKSIQQEMELKEK